jgi:hypothetical protein
VSKANTWERDAPRVAVHGERRQEERLEMKLPGEIKIIERTGRLVRESVTIENWSETGCRFESGIPLKTGDIVTVKLLDAGDERTEDHVPYLFEIVWTNRRVAFWIAGALRLQGDKLASAKFPPAYYIPRRSSH